MKSHSSYKKRSRPVSLLGNQSNGKSLESSKALQLLQLEERVNHSEQVRQGGQLQLKADKYAAQLKRKKVSKKKKTKPKAGEFTPSKQAKIHVYEYPYGNKKIKGHLNIDGEKFIINSYFKALKGIEKLKSHRDAPGFERMMDVLYKWLQEIGPDTENTPDDGPEKKKHEDPHEEENTTVEE